MHIILLPWQFALPLYYPYLKSVLNIFSFYFVCGHHRFIGTHAEVKRVHGLVLPVYHVGSGDWTQVTRSGSRCIYPLNHFTSLRHNLLQNVLFTVMLQLWRYFLSYTISEKHTLPCLLKSKTRTALHSCQMQLPGWLSGHLANPPTRRSWVDKM